MLKENTTYTEFHSATFKEQFLFTSNLIVVDLISDVQAKFLKDFYKKTFNEKLIIKLYKYPTLTIDNIDERIRHFKTCFDIFIDVLNDPKLINELKCIKDNIILFFNITKGHIENKKNTIHTHSFTQIVVSYLGCLL
jgi:hypothetical protein